MTAFSTIDKLEILKIPEVQKLFLEVMQDIADRAIVSEMIAAIEANDLERLVRATGFTSAALGPFIDALEQVYRDSADTTVSAMPKQIRTPTGLAIFRFDMRNPKVEQDIRQNSSALITRLTDEARQNVRAILEQGVLKGLNPRTTALDIIGRVDPVTQKRIGGVIGLTNNQTNWVRSVNTYLEQRDPQYFTLTLRNKRFDSIVQKAIDTGTALSSDDVSRITTAYKNNALKYRGETIARTETIQSINRGEFMANTQLLDEGLVSRDAMTKEWDDVGDKKVRHNHRALAAKYGDGNGIPLDEPFEALDGTRMMYPGDSSMGAGANEIANCRCRLHVRVNWLAGVA